MRHLQSVKAALEEIDRRLGEEIRIEELAGSVHLSPYFFHRLFTAVVGAPPAAYVRRRRLLRACMLLCTTSGAALSIALDCGFSSAQAFSRAFKRELGVSPGEYRRKGVPPYIPAVDDFIIEFTHRIKGGMDMKPNIIRRGRLLIAGACGDGNQTAEVWQEYERLCAANPLVTKESDNGYEIRLYEGGKSHVHVGGAVKGQEGNGAYTFFSVPPGMYASFDIYVRDGYDSQNEAMEEWLASNAEGYSERLLDGKHFCVEYYDERFAGSEAGSIVEIWIPIEKASV